MCPDGHEFVFTEVIYTLTFEINLSGGWSFQDDHMFHQNGLPAAARSYDNGGFALLGSQRDIVKDEFIGEVLGEVLDHDHAVISIYFPAHAQSPFYSNGCNVQNVL